MRFYFLKGKIIVKGKTCGTVFEKNNERVR